jgi:hypothetical protein
VPTIADLIGVEIPWRVDGVSVLGAPRPEFPRRFYQWDPIWRDPEPGVLFAKRGEFLTFPAEPNFAKVLNARAAPAGGDPRLRPYRNGKYGALIGSPVDRLVDRGETGATRLFVPDPRAFANIDPTARRAPWAYLHGVVADLGRERHLAFAVNGVVAGVTSAAPIPGSENGYYSVSLPPSLFRKGRNPLTAYVISGPPDAPLLHPVPIGGNPGEPSTGGSTD